MSVKKSRPAGSVWRITGWTVAWVVITVGALLYGIARWIRNTFGVVTIDQLQMNLPSTLGTEVTAAENSLIRSFMIEAVAIPVGLVLAALGLYLLAQGIVLSVRRRLEKSPNAQLAARWRRLVDAGGGAAAIVMLATGSIAAAQTVSLPQYVDSLTTSVTMADYYVGLDVSGDGASGSGPVHQPVTSDPQMNLITIYLESVDDAFSDAELFEANLLEPVDRVTEGWLEFDELTAYSGGGWTMAGLVGTQCGVPLRGPANAEAGSDHNEIGSDEASFMPGATCLGDVLKAAGYSNVFLGGADTSFASKGRFLEDHGFDLVKGFAEWEAEGVMPEADRGIWGLPDRTLFQQAKQEVTRLHDSGQPFHLSLLTVDFHAPAHLDRFCRADFDEDLSSVLWCSMNQVAGFIEHLEESGYLEDTVVVVMADHPLMLATNGTYWDELGGAELEERPLFHRIWTPDETNIVRDEIDQLSMYATMLELLGFGLDGGQAGLGVSAINESAQGAAVLALTEKQYATLLNSRSSGLYGQLWEQSS